MGMLNFPIGSEEPVPELFVPPTMAARPSSRGRTARSGNGSRPSAPVRSTYRTFGAKTPNGWRLRRRGRGGDDNEDFSAFDD
jgi:hypothetical protein